MWIHSNMRTLHDKNIQSDEVQFHMVLIDVLNIAVRFLEYMTGRIQICQCPELVSKS